MPFSPDQPIRPLFTDALIAAFRQRRPEAAAAIDAIRHQTDDALYQDLLGVGATSDFFAVAIAKDPGLLPHLFATGLLTNTAPPPETTLADALCSVDSETTLALTLRRIRLCHMLAICFRDLSGRASLTETTHRLSHLAETIVDMAATWLHDRLAHTFGEPMGATSNTPQKLIILAMGKLGAGELNFSSDIDLMFAYPEAGDTNGDHSITNEEFFARLARKFIAVFQNGTGDLLFRVDLRLRPFGESGPVVMHFDAMEFYYQTQGREWERYALIKSRAISGNASDAAQLMDRLRPFVFRRYLDYGVFDSLREMKASIMTEVRRKGMAENIKTGSGGIREVEFFGQAFQLLRGGVEKALQDREILPILQALVTFRLITPRIREDLVTAYIFLRHTEHRIQAWEDRQTHLLPAGGPARDALVAAMGYPDWSQFTAVLEDQRRRVHFHFRGLLATDTETRDAAKPLAALWNDPEMDAALRKTILTQAGFRSPETVHRRLLPYREDPATRALSHDGRKRLDTLMPILLERCGASEDPELALDRLLELIKTVQRRTTYLALFQEHPKALDHLIHLSLSSSWLTDFLTRHPVLLDELLDSRTLYTPPDKKEMAEELHRRMERIDAADLEAQIETLCVFKQVNLLRVAAADVTGEYPLMKVSDRLSEIAETITEAVMDFSSAYLVERHGRPTGTDGTPLPGRGFAVIGYGKLGGLELGYGSDLDLVFLHRDTEGETEGPDRRILSRQFFTRLGQRVIHYLKAHTRAGTLYDTDLRLRPDGNTGILVVPVSAFAEYQRAQAWTWEHQALVRARLICGDPDIGTAFEEVRKEILCRKRDPETLRNQIADMRKKMRTAAGIPEAGFFDLKQDPGGMVDIEFLVQYLVLRHAHTTPSLTRWTDNIRILETISETGVLPVEEATFLRTAYLLIRAAVHKQNLQNRPSKVPEEPFVMLRDGVRRIWASHMEPCV